ncbi:hypothetical protein PR048_024129 [Dryococelus australis]|uniref:Uncharacterized protein n=1 Tax=Dryococelus australis TaxID=614101 RepID=A0ABQ9GW60_9NEOP|nr:hypothetical protein PR048_024129 [Dryococelus australis]
MVCGRRDGKIVAKTRHKNTGGGFELPLVSLATLRHNDKDLRIPKWVSRNCSQWPSNIPVLRSQYVVYRVNCSSQDQLSVNACISSYFFAAECPYTCAFFIRASLNEDRCIIFAAFLATVNAGYLSTPASVSYYSSGLTSSAGFSYASPAAITSSHSNILRTPGNLGQVSTYSKTVDTPYSSVTKSDVRVSNPGLAYTAAAAPAIAAYSTPAYSSSYYGSAASSARYGSAALVAPAAVTYSSSLAAPASVSYSSLAAPAAVSYAAQAALASPAAITSSHSNILRTAGNLGQVSTYSKTIDTPYSSVSKSDVRVSNPGVAYTAAVAPAVSAYAAPAYSSSYYGSAASSARYGSAALVAPAAVTYSSSLAAPASVSYSSLAAPAAVSYGAQAALASPAAITSSHSNILRSPGNLGQVSTYSKTIDTPYSSVSKSDVRVSNPGVAYTAAVAPAVSAYAAPAYSSSYYGSAASSARYGSAAVVAPASVSYSSSLAAPASVSYSSLAAPAAVSYGAQAALASPAAITSSHSNILRSPGNLGQVSTYSKTIDTPYSSVSKSDVRVSNPGVAYTAAVAPAVSAYAAPAYSSSYYGSAASSARYGSAALVAPASVTYSSSLAAPASVSYSSLAAPAAVSYGAQAALASPAAITSSHSNILRSPGNLGQVSTYSKTIDTPYSSVSKSDVRVSNPGVAYTAAVAPAVSAYAAPAYSSSYYGSAASSARYGSAALVAPAAVTYSSSLAAPASVSYSSSLAAPASVSYSSLAAPAAVSYAAQAALASPAAITSSHSNILRTAGNLGQVSTYSKTIDTPYSSVSKSDVRVSNPGLAYTAAAAPAIAAYSTPAYSSSYYGSAASSARYGSAAVVAPAAVTYSSSLAAPASVSYSSLAAPAAVSYGAQAALASPAAITSSHSNILRTPGNLGQVSTYSKTVDTPYSSVTKSDVRVSNPGIAYSAAAPAVAAYAAPAYSSSYYGSSAYSRGYGSAALVAPAAVSYSSSLAAPAAITSSHSNILRSPGNLGQLSTYSKTVNTPYSSVSKSDVRVSNSGVAYGAYGAIAAPAYATSSYGFPAYARAYAAPATYATYAGGASHASIQYESEPARLMAMNWELLSVPASSPTVRYFHKITDNPCINRWRSDQPVKLRDCSVRKKTRQAENIKRSSR